MNRTAEEPSGFSFIAVPLGALAGAFVRLMSVSIQILLQYQ